MIIIFTHIKFSRIYSPARKYVLRKNFYVYSISDMSISIWNLEAGSGGTPLFIVVLIYMKGDKHVEMMILEATIKPNNSGTWLGRLGLSPGD